MATQKRMLEHVASWLDRDGVEYERQHFDGVSAKHFDPCLSLPTGSREAVEIDADTTEPATFTVTLRAWDASGGLTAEKEIGQWTGSSETAAAASAAVAKVMEQEPPQAREGIAKTVLYEVWEAPLTSWKTLDGQPVRQVRNNLITQEVAQDMADTYNAEEAENARTELRETRRRFVVVKATTIRKVMEG